MTKRNRDYFKQEFKDGERPSGKDFEDLFESFINQTDDGISMDEDGNVLLSRGVRLSNSAGTETGTLRFHNNKVQFFDGSWQDIASGSSGAFQPVDGSSNVAYTAGNVGIGAFAAAPTYRLEVNLGSNTSEAERVRFGKVVCSNGTAPDHGYACFSHEDHANNISYALRQAPDGEVHINAPFTTDKFQTISMRQTSGDRVHTRLFVSDSGNVVIGGNVEVSTDFKLQVDGAAFIGGEAFKADNSETWNVMSDVRVKENVRDLEMGLEQLMRVRPVRFRYNGKAGTRKGKDGVGIIGQEIEQVFPEMVQRVSNGIEPDIEDLLIYNGSALKYVLVNAVKQLAEQVDELKQALAESKNSAE